MRRGGQRKDMGKRGMFFTLISLMIISVLLISFSSRIDDSLSSQLPVVERRVDSVNQHLSNLRNVYLERLLRISAINAFGNLTQQMRETGNFVDEDYFDVTFEQLIFRELTPRVSELINISRDELHILSDFNLKNITVYQDNQTGPWVVGVNLSVDFFVDGQVAIWNTSGDVVTHINIIGLEDPLYARNSSGNSIREHDFEDNWTIENFKVHLANQTYRIEERAPSFLNRFIGDFSGSTCCGIESLINLNKLIDDQPELGMSAVENKNASFVDYCFFGDACLGGEYGFFIRTLDGISSQTRVSYDDAEQFYKFKIDSYHVGEFNLSSFTEDVCEYDEVSETWEGDGCI